MGGTGASVVIILSVGFNLPRMTGLFKPQDIRLTLEHTYNISLSLLLLRN